VRNGVMYFNGREEKVRKVGAKEGKKIKDNQIE
jgi:hypothetical protein